MPGGTAYYFSMVLNQLECDFKLLTAVSIEEQHVITGLRNSGINVLSVASKDSVYFVNKYDENQIRTQNVLSKATQFTSEHIEFKQASYIHLGLLLNDDITIELIQPLSTKGKISLDIQGFLRHSKHRKIIYSDWLEKEAGLKYVHTLKANESEAYLVVP